MKREFSLFSHWRGIPLPRRRNKLKKKLEINETLKNYITLSVILNVISGFISFFSFLLDFLLVGPVFVLIGLYLINKKAIEYFSLQNLEFLTNLEKIQNNLTQNKFFGQDGEEFIKQVPELKIAEAEFKSDLFKISEKSIQEDVVEQIYESIKQPESIIKEESPQIDHKITVLKTETEPKIKFSPQKVNTNKFGFTNIRKSLKKLSKEPIQSKITIKEDISQVSKKKCPFCGKKREDLNVPFYYACGYKFK